MHTLFLHPPKLLYERFIAKQRKGVTFTVLFFFLVTFMLARLYVYLAVQNIIPDSLTQNIRGVHVHHFAWGILLNSVVGYILLVLPSDMFEEWKIKLSAIFGIGLGLTFDEFGMWLYLQDEYWVRQSYDAIIIISILFIDIIYLGNTWKRLFYYALKIRILDNRFGTKETDLDTDEAKQSTPKPTTKT